MRRLLPHILATLFSCALIPLNVFASPVVQTSAFELIPKGTIPYAKLGINAFVNESRFGTIRGQFREVRNTLRIKNVRVLMRWDDNVQPGPRSKQNFSFYDNIVNNLQPGMNAVIVLTGVPSWMNNSAHWINGDPRKTFVEKWVRQVVSRYGARGRVAGWQIWNEPNTTTDTENQLLGFPTAPEKYVAMLSDAFEVAHSLAPSKLVVSAATTAINQNFPKTFEYNEKMVAAGIEDACDIWGMHYYGTNYENILFFGLADFLNSISKPIWVTESGIQGSTKQLGYGQRTWPFLLDYVPSIERIYIYQFAESSPAPKSFGLKNITAGSSISDLYIHLRDRR